MTLPNGTNATISMADFSTEMGDSYNTQHGLDWVFEKTRPNWRPTALGYALVTINDGVNGGTIDIANSNMGYYTNSPGTGPGWAYFNNSLTNSNCNNGNCTETANADCGNVNCLDCYNTAIDCTTNDSQAWLQPNCNCACTFNCTSNQYSYNCNCDCPWICACACW